MPLPAPDLDDRRFQPLVDEAKRLVQQRCPEWTDHNVSDPGVTLIETFALMVDQLIYRLNRVPDRNYVKFLELIGVRLFPPTAARAPVTFWLSAPQADDVVVPAGTEVGTVRTDAEEAVVFATNEELRILTCSLTQLASAIEGTGVRHHPETVAGDAGFECFDKVPKPGDSLLVGLSDAVPRAAVVLRFDLPIEGVGVDPLHPPLRWEAWDGQGWAACEVDHDDTGGLNRAGDVVVHVPAGHVASLISGQRAGWLRAEVVEAEEGQPVYSASPRVLGLTAHTIGGTVDAVHAEEVQEEILGLSEGVPGQRFELKRRPVVAGDEPPVLEVAAGDGWQEWTCVEDFAGSGKDDCHFSLDGVFGEVVFGPAVREPDGTLRQYGAFPPKGAPLRLRRYRSGGGRKGNVARGAIVVLKSTIPYVTRVENRRPASGGVDGEDVAAARVRGPVVFRTRNRAVTAEDFEELARSAGRDVARVRCVPAGAGAEAGAVRVLVVPAVGGDDLGRLRFEQLIPADDILERIARHLDERRTIGARVVVEPPRYQGITVVARIRARPRTSASRLQRSALEALYRYFHPIVGGPDGDGWPFGRPVHVGEVYAVLQQVSGVELIEDARLFAADPVTGQRGEAIQRLELGPHELVFSYEHQLRVEEA